ncbi:MAG: hypothetical protein ABI397_02670 [Candidatus Saccharimonas sp.]
MNTLKQTNLTHQDQGPTKTLTEVSEYFGYPAEVTVSESEDSSTHEVIGAVPASVKSALAKSTELAIELEKTQQASQELLAAETARVISENHPAST